MGVNIKDIITKEKTTVEYFASKTIAIDAYNAIYQFLASIRGVDGQHLSDSRGNVTSHLSGLYNRNISFLTAGIKPIYVFDGKSPSLKSAEIERRAQIKKDAAIKYEIAIKEGNMQDAKKYAQQTTSLQDHMIDEAKQLLDLLGIPYVNAPSEGEATAAFMSSNGLAYAAASQDYDSVLFGAKRLIRNFTNSGRRKVPNKNTYIDVVPEIIETQKVLDNLELSQGQLIDVSILVGTDFNPNGFRRIGPKTALKLIRKYNKLEEIPDIQEQLNKVDYEQIREIFLNPKVPDTIDIKFNTINTDGVIEYLVEQKEFKRDRIQNSLDRLKKAQERHNENLDKWF